MEIEHPERDATLAIGKVISQSINSYITLYKANQRININDKDNIYFLSKGNVSAHSTNGGILIFNIFAPDVICLEHLRNIKTISHLRCVTAAEIHVISVTDAIPLFNSNSLWASAFYVSLQYLHVYNVRASFIHQPTIKDAVIKYLQYIWSFSPSQRKTISIYVYISQRAYISRSAIHKAVSELINEGLISVERGVLTDCKLS